MPSTIGAPMFRRIETMSSYSSDDRAWRLCQYAVDGRYARGLQWSLETLGCNRIAMTVVTDPLYETLNLWSEHV